LTFVLTAGNVNDCTMFTQMLAGIWMPEPGRGRWWNAAADAVRQGIRDPR
jgi:hypothetical protein